MAGSPATRSDILRFSLLVPLRVVVLWGVLVVVTTELMSATGFLGRGGVLVSWLTLVVPLALLRWVGPGRRRRSLNKAPEASEPLTLPESFYLACIFVVLIVTLVLALIAAPNAGDALSYHMARVAHWIQNRSIAFYPTNNDRQLWSNPWSEFVILQLQLISGGDRWSNLVQWSAFAGSIALVVRITGLLGCQREVRLFAGLVAATIPMAIAQSTGAQNDLAAGFWLLVFVALVIEESGSVEKVSLLSAAVLGGSLGLAVLTKGTNYIYALPFLVWWGIGQWAGGRRNWRRQLVIVGLAALALNATHYERNFRIYHWPLGPRDSDGIVNAAFGPRLMLSNLLRNVAIHAGTPDDTRLPASIAFNAFANKTVERVHGWIGLDPSDPRTTLRPYRFRIPFEARTEVFAGNPLHVVMIVVSIGAILLRGRVATRLVHGYSLSLVGAVLLFCLLIRWQPFASRLQLPIFVAAAPLIALAMGDWRWTRRLMLPIAALLFFRAVPFLFKNAARPLVNRVNVAALSREERYFIEWPQLRGPYTGAAEFISLTPCRDIGVKSGWGEWEYAFWVVARNRLGSFQFTHVSVTNPSRRLVQASGLFPRRPCAVVTLSENEPGLVPPLEPGFVTAWRKGNVTVQMPLRDMKLLNRN